MLVSAQKPFFLLAVNICIVALVSFQALAKGLEDIAPKKEPQKGATSAGDENKDTEPTSQQGEQTPSESKNHLLSEKAMLSTSFGWVSGSGTEGDWQTAGMSDFTAGYILPFELGDTVKLFGTLRYAPFDVDAKIESYHYKGTVQGYHFGALGKMLLSSAFSVAAQAELGMMIVNLSSVDELPSDGPGEHGGGAFSLGAEAAWVATKHLELGGKVNVTLGSFSAFQLAFSTNILL